MIKALFAIDNNNGMGYHGSMPWPTNRDDMRWFKSTTTNQIVVMGKKTWDSAMPTPLPNRHNVVITHSHIKNVHTISDNIIEECIRLATTFTDKTTYIIGGPNIIMQLEPIIDELLITRIPANYPCDTFIDLPTLLTNFTLVFTKYHQTCSIEHYERLPRHP
jgi:dihydrofolate reductase